MIAPESTEPIVSMRPNSNPLVARTTTNRSRFGPVFGTGNRQWMEEYIYGMTNHLTGGPPAKLSRAFVYEFPNKFKPTNVLLKTTHGHVMRACDDMQVRYLNSL